MFFSIKLCILTQLFPNHYLCRVISQSSFHTCLAETSLKLNNHLPAGQDFCPDFLGNLSPGFFNNNHLFQFKRIWSHGLNFHSFFIQSFLISQKCLNNLVNILCFTRSLLNISAGSNLSLITRSLFLTNSEH